jgi:branched-subunit amino acid aminotransferase/4-amino-4-deoxychorismate lyase
VTENMNRAFMYGESVFTTMRMKENQVKDWDLHFDRLKRGVEFLYGPFSQGDNFGQDLRERLENRWQQENGHKILRLTIYRDQEERGLIRRSHMSVADLKVHLHSANWDGERQKNQTLSLSLRTCAAPLRPYFWPPYLKAGNYLPTIMSQKFYLQPGDDDLLFLSHDDTVLESSVANIFIVRKDKLFTAPLGPQVLEGVMRKKTLDHYQDFFKDCDEDASSLDQLYKSDAVFATNSVRGVMMIGKVDDRDLTIRPETLEKLMRLHEHLMS